MENAGVKITAGIALVFILAYVAQTFETPRNINEDYIERSGPLLLKSIYETQDRLHNLEVVGKVKNISSSNLDYAEIEVRLLNSNGDMIDSGLDNIRNLKAGSTWEFSIRTLNDDVEEYELVGFSGH